jgi:demethylmenaquinone methyltransferase/2-methoxy-6-polyprenyl-1,4-benzoquinol methylase
MATSTTPRGGSGEMFDAIAERYDLLNRIISLGIDERWRRRTVAALELEGQERPEVLDLATGTADLALRVAATHVSARVLGIDPSNNMLAIGRDKAQRRLLAPRVELVEGDAQALPFEDDRFDGVTMAFGIQNVSDRPRALQEMARVTRPDGRIAILELSEPTGGVMGPLARFHVHHVVPTVGGILSGSREYRYLQESIAAFPSPEAFADMMRQSGLEVLRVEPLTFGVCTLYVARPAS